jgi:hypothetical protein
MKAHKEILPVKAQLLVKITIIAKKNCQTISQLNLNNLFNHSKNL